MFEELYEETKNQLNEELEANKRLDILVWNLIDWIYEHINNIEEIRKILSKNIGMTEEEIDKYMM